MVSKNTESLEKEFLSDINVKNSRDKIIELHNLQKDIEKESKPRDGIFFVLGHIEDEGYENENAHSDFLAWLLRPEQTHNLGTNFLEKFLFETLDIDNINLDQAKITREYPDKESKEKFNQSIDILIELEDRVICIENKRKSKEGDTQLNDYVQIVEEVFTNKEHNYIFLTPHGETPTHKSYEAISYYSVYKILINILDSELIDNSEKERRQIYFEDYVNFLRNTLNFNKAVVKQFRRFPSKYNQILKKQRWDFLDSHAEWEEFIKIMNELGIKAELDRQTEKENNKNLFLEALKEDYQITSGDADGTWVRFLPNDIEEYFKISEEKWLFEFEFQLRKVITFQGLVRSGTGPKKEYRKKLESVMEQIDGYTTKPDNNNYGHYNSTEFDIDNLNKEKVIEIIDEIRDTVARYQDIFLQHKETLLNLKSKYK